MQQHGAICVFCFIVNFSYLFIFSCIYSCIYFQMIYLKKMSTFIYSCIFNSCIYFSFCSCIYAFMYLLLISCSVLHTCVCINVQIDSKWPHSKTYSCWKHSGGPVVDAFVFHARGSITRGGTSSVFYYADVISGDIGPATFLIKWRSWNAAFKTREKTTFVILLQYPIFETLVLNQWSI